MSLLVIISQTNRNRCHLAPKRTEVQVDKSPSSLEMVKGKMASWIRHGKDAGGTGETMAN